MSKAVHLLTLLILLFLITGCGVTPSAGDSPAPIHDPDPTAVATDPFPANAAEVEPEDNTTRLMLFGEKNGVRLFVQSLTTGETQTYQNPVGIVDLLDRGFDGCDLIAITEKGYLAAPFNSNGGSNWLAQFTLQDLIKEKILFPPLLSPDNQKIAYLAGNGELISGMELSEYEYQDLIVKKIDDEQGEFRLTSNGGAKTIISRRYTEFLSIWSPNSQWILYSDLDQKGSYQLFISTFDGSQKIQITQREVVNEGPFEFTYDGAWAPSSEYLAVSYFDGSLKTEILSVPDAGERDVIEDSTPLWWVSDDELLIVHQRGVALYDVKSREVKEIVANTQQRLHLLAPFGGREKVGYFLTDPSNLLSSSFFVFDIREHDLQKIELIRLPSEKTEFWLYLPNGLDGNCN